MSLDNNIKFLGVNSNLVDLTEKKDSKNNSKTEYYSLDDIRGYKVYTALLTQTGENAPVATVLENTLGDIVWSRVDVGIYKGNLSGSFIKNKTALILGTVYDGDTSSVSYNGLFARESTNNVFITTFLGSEVSEDDALFNTLVEIRVYN